MPYGNYSFVVNNSFRPFSMEEMLVPFTAYQNAYEKDEERYLDLQNKADNFRYLANTLPEDSKARQIYEGYVNDLRKYGEDFGRNGLSMSNRRGLLSMRRRYQGEIGRLDKADTALQEEMQRRTALSSNDPSTLYAIDNLSINDFLDRKKPNTYSVSGNKLYERGVQIGASDSARIWSNPKVQQINKYYQAIEQTTGRTPELLAAWQNDLSTIPELRDQVYSTLKDMGVTDNLKGINYDRALKSVVNGVMVGSTYKRSDNIQRDLSQMSASEQSEADYRAGSLKLQKDELDWKKQEAQRQENWIYTHDEKGNRTGYNPILGGSTTGIPDGFYQDPKDGQLKRTPKGYKPDPSSPTGLVKDDSSPSDSVAQKFADAVGKLTYKDLAHNKGFQVKANNRVYNYKYVGAVQPQSGGSKSNGNVVEGGNGYVSGALGKDVPGRFMDWTSSSNVMNWGNFSAEGADKQGKDGMRVLSDEEASELLQKNTAFANHVNALVTAAKGDPNADDIRIISVPNEEGNSRMGYLVAIEERK